MATEAARLKRKKKHREEEEKADLTHTGLLMEGVDRKSFGRRAPQKATLREGY